jgi:signal transduction histidine kinase
LRQVPAKNVGAGETAWLGKLRYRGTMRFFSSLRSRVLAVILLATLLPLVNSISGYRQERVEALARLDREVRTMLNTTLLQETQVVSNVHQLLRIMSNANDLRDLDPIGCSGLATRLMLAQPYYANIGAALPNGDVFCSGVPPKQAINIADRPYFDEVISTHQPTHGAYQIGRASGQRAITYALPLLDGQQGVRAVLFAATRLDWFEQMVKAAPMPPGWQAQIITEDDFVAARYPGNAGDETRLDEASLNLLKNTRQQMTLNTVDINGTEYLLGSVPLASTRGALHLIIGTTTANAFGPSEARFRSEIIITLAVALLSLLITWFAIRVSVLDWVSRMGDVVRRFGGGQLDTRAGATSQLAELQMLAQNFDAMAENIETHNRNLELRVAERTAALTRSNAELETFAYSVSHDLRAPLRAISGFADILRERHRPALDAEGQRYLENVKNAADRMQELIDDLLRYSRVGRETPNQEPVPLAPLLQNVTILFEPRCTHGGEISIQEPLATPLGDARLIEDILTNLLDNAFKYQPAGQAPKVQISTKVAGSAVELRVTDNGIGIDPEYHASIFNVFQRLHTEEQYPGTGIGLAIAAKSAHLMNGTLAVEAAPGQGSTFVLRLPAAQGSRL